MTIFMLLVLAFNLACLVLMATTSPMLGFALFLGGPVVAGVAIATGAWYVKRHQIAPPPWGCFAKC